MACESVLDAANSEIDGVDGVGSRLVSGKRNLGDGSYVAHREYIGSPVLCECGDGTWP